MRIGIDIMGGDFAPIETIKGVLSSQEQLDEQTEVVLIGQPSRIKSTLEEEGGQPDDFEIIAAEEIIEMGENPVKSTSEKKDSSIVKGLHALKEQHIDGFASAGNTGAVLVAALYSVKTISNISRPALFSVLPKMQGDDGIILDVGANADAKPENLYQFGLLGDLYAKKVLNIDTPKVGLLNIGEEEGKGNLLTQEAYKIMKEKSSFNFVGNVEGHHLFTEKADVVVCDGFTGNIVLKTAESITQMIGKAGGGNNKAMQKFNYENYGGTPILGINAPVVIGHGTSSHVAVANMIKLTENITKSQLVETIKKRFN